MFAIVEVDDRDEIIRFVNHPITGMYGSTLITIFVARKILRELKKLFPEITYKLVKVEFYDHTKS